jgi:hypothetical protein
MVEVLISASILRYERDAIHAQYLRTPQAQRVQEWESETGTERPVELRKSSAEKQQNGPYQKAG